MDKKIIYIIAGVVILAAAGLWAWQAGWFAKQGVELPPLPEGIVLFYGDGCSHCKNVDDFVSQNKVEEKVKFTKLEVWYNQNNQKILLRAMQECGLKTDEVGVPFLYDGDGKCYSGDVDVINFFKNAANIQ